jgi:hypothetical protein
MIYLAAASIIIFFTALFNSTNRMRIDEEIRQEYVNSYKMNGYYYKQNLEKAKKDALNAK